jgi:hypothetical protein
MPKTPERRAREEAEARQAELEARFQYDAIGPRWPWAMPPLEYQEVLRKKEERRREREQRLALRIEKPTSTAHFVSGRYSPDWFGRGHFCRDCGERAISDRWRHDEFHHSHLTSTPGAGVIMFLETLECLFGEES